MELIPPYNQLRRTEKVQTRPVLNSRWLGQTCAILHKLTTVPKGVTTASLAHARPGIDNKHHRSFKLHFFLRTRNP